MADTPPDVPLPESDPAEGGADLNPHIGIDAQYIKDLSFENPLGPMAVAAMQQNPEVSVEVTTAVRPLEAGRYEVTLFIRGEAKTSDAAVFILELTYAGLMTLANVPEDAIGPVLLIEGARMLFPFARNIVAEITRDGGFPPLFINPIDFVQLYREQHMKGDAATGNGSGTS